MQDKLEEAVGHGWLQSLLVIEAQYRPLLDAALKVLPLITAAAVAMGLCLWLLFSAFLGYLGQPALPLSQATDWLLVSAIGGFGLIFLGLLVFAPAALTSRLEKKARRLGAIIAAFDAVALPALSLLPSLPSAAVIALIVTPAALLGFFWYDRSIRRRDLLAVAVTAALASFSMILWFAILVNIIAPISGLAPILGQTGADFVAIGILAVLLVLELLAPQASALVGGVLLMSLAAYQVSPATGNLIPTALYQANLGGGRPAAIDQDLTRGEICNLAIAERPVRYLEPKGCTRAAAVVRLRALRDIPDLERRRCLRRWAQEADASRMTRARSGTSSHLLSCAMPLAPAADAPAPIAGDRNGASRRTVDGDSAPAG